MDKQEIKDRMYGILRQYWGYTSFRYLQEDVIFSILDGRDSLTMLPTGGGKSLCFQLPALMMDGMAVVISPLISLMKDQVDGLKDIGLSAECLNSSMTLREQREVTENIKDGNVKLLYISPERLQTEPTIELLRSVPLSFFVIDEAHCISHWGHDFRADYRNLWIIKDVFGSRGVHSFTATATIQVQQDIINQLRLTDIDKHIGHIDRPNLTYRVIPRNSAISQISSILEKHTDEPGIIYCLKRSDVDMVSQRLNERGFVNLPYHAGLSDETRHNNQERFVREEVDIIVATVAFGMGIDRSNIRFVIHAAMPKTIEHYHQETGRAGRDGLPSSCYMLYGGLDFRIHSFFLEKSGEKEVMMDKLRALYDFCAKPQCRHKVLTNYFGQDYDKPSCGACDYCLGEVDMVDDPLTVGKLILLCVDDVAGKYYSFGAAHIVNILKGKKSDKVLEKGHDSISSFGVMHSESVAFIRYMVEQMVGQGFLERDEEYSTLSVTALGEDVIAGKITPMLAKPVVAAKKKEIAKKSRERREEEWKGADQDLFQALRRKRSELAGEKGVPAYIIFSDSTLKDMASVKPLTEKEFSAVFGVGESKLKKYGAMFIKVIQDYENGI